MTHHAKYPFVRMLIPLALGIWCCSCLPDFRIAPWVLMAITIALFGIALAVTYILKRFRYNWIFGAVMAIYLFMAGYALTRVHEAEVQKDYYRNFESGARYYVARVFDDPTERESNIRAVLALEYQFGDSVPSRPVTGKVMAYFPKSDSAFALQYGDLIAIPAPIRELTPPLNPEEFDYRAYLIRKGITGQCFLKDEEWMGLQVNNANPIYAFSYRFRDILLRSLAHCGLKDNEYGVAAAMLLGYRESLADEMHHKYIGAGAMHILCVSGMHVGIVYLVASFLLGFLNRKKWQKVLKESFLLALVWLYALIAGLTLSILRSALMLTFVIIGEVIRRKGFIINSIAASAFFLLCLNPNNLFEIGFLLSYSAVIGIVVLHKPIYHLFYVKNRLLDRAWDITAVALAAQIATIPFTLFYFNQFTTYFWLSNLVMTPVSFIVVVSGMVLLLVSWIPYLNTLVGYLVWGAVYVMNVFVSWVDGLPFSVLKGLYVSDFEFVMLIIAFMMLLLSVTLRKRHLIIGMLGALLLLMVSVTVRLYASEDQKGMAVFSLRKHTAVDFVVTRDHVLLADSALMSDESTVDYSLKGAWTKWNLSTHPEVVALDADYDGDFMRKRSNLVSYDGQLLALWDDACRVEDSLSYRMPVDYLLVLERQKPDVQSVVNNYDAKLLLIDGSVPRYLAEQWMSQADALHLPYFDVGKGAFLFQTINSTNPNKVMAAPMP